MPAGLGLKELAILGRVGSQSLLQRGALKGGHGSKVDFHFSSFIIEGNGSYQELYSV